MGGGWGGFQGSEVNGGVASDQADRGSGAERARQRAEGGEAEPEATGRRTLVLIRSGSNKLSSTGPQTDPQSGHSLTREEQTRQQESQRSHRTFPPESERLMSLPLFCTGFYSERIIYIQKDESLLAGIPKHWNSCQHSQLLTTRTWIYQNPELPEPGSAGPRLQQCPRAGGWMLGQLCLR